MTTYLFPIKQAIIIFPIVAMFLTLPFLIYQWRKHHYLNKFRAFIFYTFILYIICTYFLIILPLPATRNNCGSLPADVNYYQLKPFTFAIDFLNETRVNITNPATYKYLFGERAFLQAAFNAILLTPLGIYLRYYFKKSFKSTVLICFLASLSFEVTQVTGIYGIYRCPYRLFDIDDLILNTFGGVLGYLIAPMFGYFLPDTKNLDKDIEVANLRVGLIRRGIAFSIDLTILNIIMYICNIEIKLINYAIVIFIYFVLGTYFTKGLTLGKFIVSIKLKAQEERLKFKNILLRYFLLFFFIYGINSILLSIIRSITSRIEIGILIIVFLIYNSIVLLHIVSRVFTKDKLLFYEKISKVVNGVYVRKKNID